MVTITPTQAQLCARSVLALAPRFAEGLTVAGVDTVQFTKRLTSMLQELMAATAVSVEKEHWVEPGHLVGGPSRTRGRLDLYAILHDCSRLAVEIDRGNKQWSLAKLHAAASDSACTAIWIRWRGLIKFESCHPVQFLDLTRYGNQLVARGKTARQRGAGNGA